MAFALGQESHLDGSPMTDDDLLPALGFAVMVFIVLVWLVQGITS